MKPSLYHNILFRIPQFALNAQLEDCWDELIKSIQIASPDFYVIIKDLPFSGLEHQPKSVQVTLFKYFNRAMFRATPYGTFAAFGMCNLGRTEVGPLVVQSTAKPIHFTDWSLKEVLADYWKSIPINELVFFANSSWYKIDQYIRYIYREENQFELSDIPFYPLIIQILTICQNPTRYDSLVKLVAPEGLTKDELQGIIEELVEAQLLFTNYHPNIIGKDYFSRISIKDLAGAKPYTITRVGLKSGGFYHPALKQFDHLIPLLHSIQPKPERNTELEQFINAFSRKYDQSAIPLMMALDPEIGIGYGNLEISQDVPELIKEIEANKLVQPAAKAALHQLVKETVLNDAGLGIIRLEDLNMDKAEKPYSLPNTMSALISIANEEILVGQLGGATANALLGRFTLASDELLDTTKALAEIEQNANPEVLFFDIAYTGEVTVDNVNRRQQIYPYSLGILNFDTSAEPLNLTDLYIKMQGDELILFSKKYQKRLIPRISTAYNYTRSDLSLFRLLCDLQHQGLQTNLLPDMEHIMPGLRQYPRLVYRNLILALAKWLLVYKEEYQNLDLFKNYLLELKLPGTFKIGFADQTLQLELGKGFDVYILQTVLKKNITLWAREVIKPKTNMINDDSGNGYASEFVLSFTHQQQIYQGLTDLVRHNEHQVQRVFAPGSEWLYYQVFVHPIRMDDLLALIHDKIIKSYHNLIEKWFFIRYNDGGEHLRIRFNVKDINSITIIMEAMRHHLAQPTDTGIISDYRICSYERELERYGTNIIENIETHFERDSIYTLACISHNYDIETLYQITIKLMQQVAKKLFGPKDNEKLIADLCDGHNKEHKLNGTTFKQLNRGFKAMQQKQGEDLSMPLTALQQQLEKSFIETIQLRTGERQMQLYADLFHMHINRLFTTNQRMHEMIIYNYILKLIKAQKCITS